jgi:hypothetical protein
MLNSRYNIAPKVQIQEQRRSYTSLPLSKVELRAFASAIKLTGIPNGLIRFVEQERRQELDDLLDSV